MADSAKTSTPQEREDEIRQVFEASDFGPELTPELRGQQESLRKQSREKNNLAACRFCSRSFDVLIEPGFK